MVGGAGFRPGPVADQLWQFRALSCWLGARGLPVAELDPEPVEEFSDARPAAGYRSYLAASSVRLPLDYLIGIGVLPLLDVSTALSPVDRLIEKHRRYLPARAASRRDDDRRLSLDRRTAPGSR